MRSTLQVQSWDTGSEGHTQPSAASFHLQAPRVLAARLPPQGGASFSPCTSVRLVIRPVTV